jgi:hypothetical protein
VDDDFDDEPVREWKLRAAAPPIAVALAVLFHASATGHWLQRTVFTMIVHEVGHAVTGWWCGFAAVPGLWKTLIPESRGVVAPLLVLAAEAGIIYVGVRSERRWLIALGVVLAVIQAIGTLGPSSEHAHAVIIFGGDGGAMVLGMLLMCTFFAPRASRLVQNGLRWGFLVIGAAAYVDSFATWWIARGDTDVIPYGEIEGVGLSDPSKLTEQFGWSEHQLVHRYVVLGVACGSALAAAWAYAVWSARRASRPA